MKHRLHIIIAVMAIFLLQSFTSRVSTGDTVVYIVPMGKVYHSTKSCRGLINSRYKIQSVSLKEAKKTRRACKICY